MAGLGLDGITLAALGCDVVMVERDPPSVRAARGRGRSRARANSTLAGRRCECREGDVTRRTGRGRRVRHDLSRSDVSRARQARVAAQVGAGAERPARCGGRRSAERSSPHRSRCAGRVVVKRRRHDAAIARPDWQILGRSVRFDVYRGSRGRRRLEPTVRAARARATPPIETPSCSTTLDARVTSPITSP